MKKIYLIRHAQSEANAAKAVRPNHQINITETGLSQAYKLAEWLTANIDEPITDIFVSAYIRTHPTAEFRDYETVMRPKNCEVYLLMDNQIITKVRTVNDGQDDVIR